MHNTSTFTTYLFTDIEGSTGLWERGPERMSAALACHDAVARDCVTRHRGTYVKSTGDGMHAVFADPRDAVQAAVDLQLALADASVTNGVALSVRSGLHAGVDTRRDNDYFGDGVNRAARVMSIAHGGQILLSQAVEKMIRERLPAELSLQDLGAVRLRGLAQTERVYQVVHSRLRQAFPPLRMLEATPNNLPQQLTSFIGREQDIAEGKRFMGSARLLTLLGIGGLGKSRLSLAIAAELLDSFADGVWFVELASVTDARLVPQAIASALGAREEPGRPVRDALVEFVRDRQLLLVLDNCEHLVQACAQIARDLLEAGPKIKILASSRERLNVGGEKVYTLEPLAVASPGQKLTTEAIAQLAAVQLFIDRAQAVNPEFALTDDNAAAVVEICHRLDGIPLAIELAAARVRAMSVQSIAERLDDRFRLLRGGDRTALPRQQTLRALIDWSHDLLSPGQQILFRRLAVFAGGFTLEAAEAVGAGPGIEESAILDFLTDLVEKSLVRVDTERERYRMLETVREYAADKLESSGEDRTIRRRHLEHYLRLAEALQPRFTGPDQGHALARLDLEWENIAAAHAWCGRAEGGGDADLRLVRAISRYCFVRGLLATGLQAMLDALGHPEAQVRNLARCRALSGAGQFAIRMGRKDESLRYLDESLAIARELGDRERVEMVLQPLAMLKLARGENEAAQAHLEEALELARDMGMKREVAAALSGLVQVHRVRGAFDSAVVLCDESLSLARELGDTESIAVNLLNRAMVSLQQRMPGPVAAMLSEALDLIVQVEALTVGQSLLEAAAGLAAARSDWSRSARYFGAAEALAGRTGLRRDPADEGFIQTVVAAGREALGTEAFTRADTEGRALDYGDAMAELRVWFAPAA